MQKYYYISVLCISDYYLEVFICGVIRKKTVTILSPLIQSSQIHFREEGLWEKTHFHFKAITSRTLHLPGTDCEGKEPCPRGLLCSTGTPKRK